MESWIGGWEGAKDFLALLHRLWHTKKFKIIKFKCFLLFCRYTTWGLPLKALALLAWRLAEIPFLGCCFHSYESNHATHSKGKLLSPPVQQLFHPVLQRPPFLKLAFFQLSLLVKLDTSSELWWRTFWGVSPRVTPKYLSTLKIDMLFKIQVGHLLYPRMNSSPNPKTAVKKNPTARGSDPRSFSSVFPEDLWGLQADKQDSQR